MSATCGGSWSPHRIISSGAASRTSRRLSPSHDTIQFGASDWDFVEDGREVRVPCTPRFITNSADAAIWHAEQGGGLTRVLAYQAADGDRGRPAQDRAGEIRAAATADPHRLSDLAAAVGQGADVCRSGGRGQRLEVREAVTSSDSGERVFARTRNPDVEPHRWIRVRRWTACADVARPERRATSSSPPGTSRWRARSPRRRLSQNTAQSRSCCRS